MPELRAFFSRWQVAGFAFAGVAEAQRHNGNEFGVIEAGVVDAHPFTQSFAAGIVPRDS